MKHTELKVKSVAELQQLLGRTRAQLFAARYRTATGNSAKSHQVKQLKRQVARILSLLRLHTVYGQQQTGHTTDYQLAVDQINSDTKAFRAKLAAKLRDQQAPPVSPTADTPHVTVTTAADTTTPTTAATAPLTNDGTKV